MTCTVAYITVEQARDALRLDNGKTADQITEILERRGMEAQAALADAMTQEQPEGPFSANARIQETMRRADMFRVEGYRSDETGRIVDVFEWTQGDGYGPFTWEAS